MLFFLDWLDATRSFISDLLAQCIGVRNGLETFAGSFIVTVLFKLRLRTNCYLKRVFTNSYGYDNNHLQIIQTEMVKFKSILLVLRQLVDMYVYLLFYCLNKHNQTLTLLCLF